MTATTIELKMLESRPYQTRVHDKITAGWGTFTSQMITMPTGSGKTPTGIVCAHTFVHEVAPKLFPGVKPEEVGVGWVAMRRNLLKQAQHENERLRKHGHDGILVPNFHPISMFDKNGADILKEYKVKIVVVDECHHDSTTSMANLHALIKPEAVLGLSATPIRSDNNQLCFQRSVEDAGYRSLIKDGYLSKFNQFMLDAYSPESVATSFLRWRDMWGKSLMFFLTRAECEACHKLLASAGVRAEVVHGGSDRDKQLDDFESGAVEVLISMSILTEGFDCPSLNTVFVRDAQSRTPTIQMAGRVLRLWQDVVKNIVQSDKTHHPFTKFADAENQNILKDGEWLSVTSSNIMSQMISKVAMLKHQVAKDSAAEQSITALTTEDVEKFLFKMR